MDMIRKLRLRLVAASMAALLVVLTILLVSLNLLYRQETFRQTDRVLDLILDRNGDLAGAPGEGLQEPLPFAPGIGSAPGAPTAQGLEGDNSTAQAMQPGMGRLEEQQGGLGLFGLGDRLNSPELAFESRFFLVSESDGETSADLTRIAAVDEATALAYAQEALSSGRQRGVIGSYRYAVSSGVTSQNSNTADVSAGDGASDTSDTSAAGTRIAFLDISREMDSLRIVALTSVLTGIASWLLVLALIWLLSARIVRPFIDNYEKQRRFITDAGHELRTPLAIIRSDSDVLEMETGPSEWIDDIRLQTTRMADLTEDLTRLARMEEGIPAESFAEFDLSQAVAENAESYRAPARTGNKELTLDIQDGIVLNGSEKSLRELVHILMDNAMKYCPEGGRIRLTLARKGRHVLISTRNNTKEAPETESLSHLFDRFYRADKARGKDGAKGYGIGLSIARATVLAHKGRIEAAAIREGEFAPGLEIKVTLPG